MSIKLFVSVPMLLATLLSTASAQAPEPAPVPVPVPDAAAPSSGIGQQVGAAPTLQVVYPRADDVVEDVVGEIEDLQLTPDQIDRIKAIYLEREQAKASPYVSPPAPVTRTVMISLDPGITPPALRLARGQQTSLVFADVSGQPWFIERVSMNRKAFSDGVTEGSSSDDPPTNVLTVEPLHAASYGNVTVTLRGLSTPVIFILTTAQEEVDMRVDAHIPGRNPDALDLISLQSLPQIDPQLSAFLDGVPPKDAKRLKLTGMDDAAAWAYRNSLYLRTKGDAQYPAYIGAARSTSGMSVYKFSHVHSSVTVLSGGRAITLFIQ